jgi:predicted nucleic acid-binding protein
VRVLLDTNIIVDDALEREPFWEESEEVLLLAEQGKIEGFISASTFGTYTYQLPNNQYLVLYLLEFRLGSKK